MTEQNNSSTNHPDNSKEAFPDFTLTTFDNKQVSLADFKGKPTFIRFTTTHCTICKAENPMLNDLWAELKDQFNFIDINIGEQAPVVSGYVKEQKITHDTALDLDSALTAKLGILGTPTHFMLNPQGQICFKATGRLSEEQFRKTLKECS